MPRPNQPRSIASEQALARRIAHERESRGWSYEGLASRLTKAGCAIQASAIYKIEKADPPRRITVDELVAFAEVFGVSIERLVLPPEVAASRELTELLLTWDRARVNAARANEAADASVRDVRRYLADNPSLAEEVQTRLAERMGDTFEAGDRRRDIAIAAQMFDLTGDPDWDQRADEAAEESVAQRRAQRGESR